VRIRKNSINSASVWKLPSPSYSATTISYKRTKIVAIWQKRLFSSFWSKIWPSHSLRRPRFPIRQMYFHYRLTFMGYIRCFCATTSHDLVTLTLTFSPWECFMYSASHVQPTYQFLFWTTMGYWVTITEYWITFPLSETVSSHAPCHVTYNRGAKTIHIFEIPDANLYLHAQYHVTCA